MSAFEPASGQMIQIRRLQQSDVVGNLRGREEFSKIGRQIRMLPNRFVQPFLSRSAFRESCIN